MPRHRMISVLRVDVSQPVLDGIDTSREPHFTAGEAAKVFFAKPGQWLRWQERKGRLTIDGKRIKLKRTESDARYFDLSDIERVARALAENGIIEHDTLVRALHLVQAEASLWGYLK